MAKADTSVKWFHSGMANGPVLRGEAGALIELLDACLINGFDSRAVDSIAVAGGVATVSLSAGNPFEQHVVIQLAGATPAALNAEWRIATSGASSFTFLCPGIADGTATGTITCKRAPAGWAKPFSATNKGVYQSIDTNTTQLYLRLDDAHAQYTRVRGYENMTDADTGDGLFPTLAQCAATAYSWPKSNAAGIASRSWALVADGSMIHFLPVWTASYPHADVFRFGDAVPLFAADAYHCAISAAAAASPAWPSHANATVMNMQYQTGCYFARGADQAAGAAVTRNIAMNVNSAGGYSSAPPVAGELTFAPQIAFHANAIRASIPGLLVGLERKTDYITRTVSEGVDGRWYLKVAVGENVSTPDGSFVALDVTGPWR
ncbi:hypothetical protein ebA7239 [Aromatoleum aromaticum EbN1]|uniref:Uncharacterized protein n=1 Tax=Aromatoleum aromaticum (strain DSM 19018 / LMG 30748 / EbN1) TaxID=76114 RepID=Q5NXI4_AROAE|nr:hypothetical protein [Aromatoleum aromaticum]CAI10230.1 hypothetical protein ebA7239 [Aromatoleum aromaticum EbN1]